eukprot:6185512-Pleurochrysis_carterae.AAC.1
MRKRACTNTSLAWALDKSAAPSTSTSHVFVQKSRLNSGMLSRLLEGVSDSLTAEHHLAHSIFALSIKFRISFSIFTTFHVGRVREAVDLRVAVDELLGVGRQVGAPLVAPLVEQPQGVHLVRMIDALKRVGHYTQPRTSVGRAPRCG